MVGSHSTPVIYDIDIILLAVIYLGKLALKKAVAYLQLTAGGVARTGQARLGASSLPCYKHQQAILTSPHPYTTHLQRRSLTLGHTSLPLVCVSDCPKTLLHHPAAFVSWSMAPY